MLAMCTDSCTSYLLWMSKITFYKVEISQEDGKAAAGLFNAGNGLRKERTHLLGIAEYLDMHRVMLRKKTPTGRQKSQYRYCRAGGDHREVPVPRS